VRFEVFKRDNFTCRYCGRRSPDVLLEVDHIIPRAAGGTDDLENLTTSCWDCNHGKGGRLLEEGSAPAVTQRAVDEAQERAEQARAYAEAVQANRQLMDRFQDMVNQHWADSFGADTEETKEGTHWTFKSTYGRFPKDGSIRRILRRLPVEDMLEAIDITSSRFHSASADAERYFFGVCWSKVTERETRSAATDERLIRLLNENERLETELGEAHDRIRDLETTVRRFREEAGRE
jgi:hypothetical protein